MIQRDSPSSGKLQVVESYHSKRALKNLPARVFPRGRAGTSTVPVRRKYLRESRERSAALRLPHTFYFASFVQLQAIEKISEVLLVLIKKIVPVQ